MTISLIDAIVEANKLALSNFDEFKKNIKVSYDQGSHHGALVTNFNIVYTHPTLGEIFKHTDEMLWNEEEDIAQNGIESHEFKNYDSFKDFTNLILVKNESGEWKVLDDDEDGFDELMEIAELYTDGIQIIDYYPNWKEDVLKAYNA